MQALHEQIQVIAFDADDTLWENEPLFREAERQWAEVLHEYGDLPTLSAALYAIEVANMEDLGYGAKAFTLSLIETAIQVTGGRLSAGQTKQILQIGRQLLHNPAAPLPGVTETLRMIREHGRYRMVLLTKGDLLDQEHKVVRSGLEPFFDRVVVVSNKSKREYRRLMKELDVLPAHFLAIGNSFKSDIKPVLELGGWGIHIPFHVLWELERTEEFDHERLFRVEEIRRILPLLLPK